MPPRSAKSSPRIARVLLRLPADLHKTLVQAATKAELSFNEFCVRRLRAPADSDAVSVARSQVISRTRALFGDQLEGAIVLGSWARGEAGATSDIDVLVVIDRARALTRDLYRLWDREPLTVDGRVVDVHFTHLQVSGATPTAVWCEAAVDGLLWYDRDGTVAMRLGEVRRAIAEGRVMRTFVHGQPYWKGAA